MHRFSADERFLGATRRPDACGLAPIHGGILVADGLGALTRLTNTGLQPLAMASGRGWENYLALG